MLNQPSTSKLLSDFSPLKTSVSEAKNEKKSSSRDSTVENIPSYAEKNMPRESQSSPPDGSSSSGAIPRETTGRRARVRGGRLPPIRQRGSPAVTVKKAFTPNIPQRRAKSKEEVEQQPRCDTENRRGRGRRGGNRDNRGRGRGRGRADLIQMTGAVFEEGIVVSKIKKEPREGYTKAELEYFPVPKCTPVRTMTKEDKEKEAETIRQLLQEDRDFDFMEDDGTKVIPVQLPLADVKVKRENDDKPDLKEDVKFGGIRVKTEPKEEFEIPKWEAKIKSEMKMKGEKAKDIFTTLLQQEICEEGVLIFFQFPDDLPFKGADVSKTKNSEKETAGEKDTLKETVPDSDKDPGEGESEEEDDGSSCFSLRNLDEGLIGKLQVLESGKVRLKLGSVTFKVESGTPVGFLQQLVSLDVNKDSGDLISLGYVRHKAVCIPDFPAILAEAKDVS